MTTKSLAEPIRDDPILDDFDDSHSQRSQRFQRFPLAMIWTILIPIGNADSYSWRSSMILDDSDPSRRFLAVRTIRDNPKIVTAVQRLFASHSSPIRLPSSSPLFGIDKFFFFFFSLYVYLFRIKDWWEDKDWNQRYVFLWVLLLCSVLVCWLIKQFLFVVVRLCIN